MSDEVDYEIAALGAVIGALGKLDSDESRQRIIDFASAKYALRSVPKRRSEAGDEASEQDDQENDGSSNLYSRFDHTKPAENVAMIVANHYSQYGTHPFTVAQIQEEAASAGLTVPQRIDMTLNGAGQKGRRFYQRVGKGTYRVTVNGETYLKSTYDVKKGKKKPADEKVG